MPHKPTLPPLPADILTPYQTRRKLARANAARRFAESGGLRRHSASPDEDALFALQSALQSGADPQQIQELIGQAEVAQKTGFKDRFMGALRAVGLPFEALAEGVNALVGPMVPQQKFQERSTQSRALLKSMFGGDLSVAEAAGALREVYEQRSMAEQLLTGYLFDPTLLIPGVGAARVASKVAATAGLRAGVKAGLQSGARKYVEWQIPFKGGKVAGKMGLPTVERILEEATGIPKSPEAFARRLRRRSAGAAAAGDFSQPPERLPDAAETIAPRTTLEEQQTLRSAMSVFYEHLANPEKLKGVPGIDALTSLYKATNTVAEQALFRLTLESGARGFEPGWAHVSDVLWADNRVLFRPKGKTPGVARFSLLLTPQTMELLRQHVVAKAPGLTFEQAIEQLKDTPLFTKGELPFPKVGTAPKTVRRAPKSSALPIGEDFNRWLSSVDARAGGVLKPGATIRNQVASAYYNILQANDLPVSLTRHFLGHAPGSKLFRDYAAHGGEDMENVALKYFMDENEKFVGYSARPVARASGAVSGEEVAKPGELTTLPPGVQAAQEVVAGLKAEVRAAPEYRDILQRKGKSLSAASREAQVRLGEAKLDNIPITEAETWRPRFAAIEKATDHDILLEALRAAEAQLAIRMLEQAEEAALLVHEATSLGAKARVANPMSKRMLTFAKDAFKERQTLAMGLRARLGYLRTEDITRTLTELQAKGLIEEPEAKAFLRTFAFLPDTAKATLEATAGAFRPMRQSIAIKTLEAAHMTAPETAEMFKLSGLEDATFESQKAAVVEWLDNEGVRKILGWMNIPLVKVGAEGAQKWVIQMGTRALETRLHRMGQGGSTTRHLLGADMVRPAGSGGLSEAARMERARLIVLLLTATRRLDAHDYLINKMASGVVKPMEIIDDAAAEALAGGAPPRKPPRTRSDIPASNAPFMVPDNDRVTWSKTLHTQGTLEDAIRYDIRSSDLVSEMVAATEKNLEEGHNYSGLTLVGHNLLKMITLPAASAGRAAQVGVEGEPQLNTLARLIYGWRSRITKIDANSKVSKLEFSRTPGIASLESLLVNNRWWEVEGGFPWFSSDLQLAENIADTEAWKTAVKVFSGRTREYAAARMVNKVPAGLGLDSIAEEMAWDMFHDPSFMFGNLELGLKPIAVDDLQKYFVLTGEQLEAIKNTREISREGTRYAIRGVSQKRILEWFGRPLSLDYVPRRERSRLGVVRPKAPSLLARGFRQPGTWKEERVVPDGIAAYELGVRYDWAPDSAFDYFADVERLVEDEKLRKLMVDNKIGTIGHALLDTQENAGRTLIRLAEAIKTNRQGELKAEYLARLLGYADEDLMKDSLTRQMGKLATDLLDNPGRVDEILPDILQAVHEADAGRKRADELRELAKGLGGLENMWFSDAPNARLAAQWFGEQTKSVKVMAGLYGASSVLRNMQAGVDGSFHLIQGLPLLMFQPYKGAQSGAAIWYRAAKTALGAWNDPAYMRAMLAHEDPEVIKSFIDSTGVFDLPHELVESTSTTSKIYGAVGGFLPGLVGQPQLGSWLKNIPTIFERMFTVYLLRIRLELWKSLRHSAEGNPERLREVAGFANKMTGVYNPATAGITQFQRHAEGTGLSFAAMFRRATYGLLVDVFRGVPSVPGVVTGTKRLDARLAQEAVGSLAVAALGMAYLIKESGNNPDALDPGSAKFMAVKGPGDHYVGFGTPFYSLVRASYAITEQALDPEYMKQFVPGRDFHPTALFNVRDNMLARWWRSQAPPLPQAGIDFIMGQTYVGESLRGKGGALDQTALLKWSGQQLLPMTIETMINEMRGVNDAPAIIGEGFGLRTFPVSLYEQWRRLANNLLLIDQDSDMVAWRRSQTTAGKPVTYEQLPGLLKTRLENSHQDLQDMREKAEADVLLRGQEKAKRRTQYFQQSRRNKAFINKTLEGVVAEYIQFGDPRRFRSRVSEARFAAVALSKASAEQYKDVVDELNTAKDVRAKDASTFLGDLWYDRYYDALVLNPELEDQNGNFRPEAYDRVVTEFKKQAGREWWDYVTARRKESHQYPNLVNEYFDAVDSLQPYWKLHYALWGKYSENASRIDDYNEASPLGQSMMKDNTPRLRRLLSALGNARLHFRDQNPELDWLLVKWYGNVPRTSLAKERLAGWEAQRR